MKKILSLIGTITLIGASTTSLVACDNSNNVENNETKKSKSKLYKQKESPEGSNWKLIKDLFNGFWELKPDNKWYILILKNYVYNNWNIMKIHLTINPRDIEFKTKTALLEAVYRWDGTNEPETPTINSSTGEITDWK